MGYIFLILAVGMATGTGNYFIAIATTLVVLLVMILLYRFNFGSMRHSDYLLHFNLDSNISNNETYLSIFDKFLKNNNLLNIKTFSESGILQLSFSIQLISDSDSQAFTLELEQIDNISNVSLIASKQDIEY